MKTLFTFLAFLLSCSLSAQIQEEWTKYSSDVIIDVKPGLSSFFALTSNEICELDTFGNKIWSTSLQTYGSQYGTIQPQQILFNYNNELLAFGVTDTGRYFFLQKYNLAGTLTFDSIYHTHPVSPAGVSEAVFDSVGNLCFTANDSAQWKAQLIKISVNGVVIKPFTSSNVFNKLNKVITYQNKTYLIEQWRAIRIQDSLGAIDTLTPPEGITGIAFSGNKIYIVGIPDYYYSLNLYQYDLSHSYLKSTPITGNFTDLYELKPTSDGTVLLTGNVTTNVYTNFTGYSALILHFDSNLKLKWGSTLAGLPGEKFTLGKNAIYDSLDKSVVFQYGFGQNSSWQSVNLYGYGVVRFDSLGYIIGRGHHSEVENSPQNISRFNFIRINSSKVYTTNHILDTVDYSTITKFCLPCQYNTYGSYFIDDNANCLPDSSDLPVPFQKVHILPEDVWLMTDQSGAFRTQLSKGSHSISASVVNPYFKQACTSSSSYSFSIDSLNPQADSLYFIVEADTPAVCDLGLICSKPIARPGFTQQYTIFYSSTGNTRMISGTVQADLDPNFIYQYAVPSPDSIAGSSYFWNYDSLDLFEVRMIKIFTSVPPTPSLIGTPYSHMISISGCQSDQEPENNWQLIQDSFRGSYDPNDKSLINKQAIKEYVYETDSSTRLIYQVNFQNTGNDTAFNIVVMDSLSPKLDLSTVEVLASSHPVSSVSISEGRMIWKFNEILLPDSFINEAGSHGFVIYQVNYDSSGQYMTDTVIKNSADIYFDYNPPVRTNNCVLLNDTSGVWIEISTSHSKLQIYPNPARENILILIDGHGEVGEITFWDLQGRRLNVPVITRQTESSCDISALPDGIYLIRLEIDGRQLFQKFVKN